MILMIDNYDSFTYNLVQYLMELGQQVEVVRNDKVSLRQLAALKPRALVVSPGPRTPDEAGVSMEAIAYFAGKIPVLGVCLGHQAMGQVFGGQVVRAARLMHGKTSPIHHDGRGLYRGLPNPFEATRYHSLLVKRETLPPSLEVSAWTTEGEIMGLRHRMLPDVEGVQFHPESILTTAGKDLLANFIAWQLPHASHRARGRHARA
jgi:anthranilate synthase/aminodeoxychorismate synthase-like glutamine amidotransferase